MAGESEIRRGDFKTSEEIEQDLYEVVSGYLSGKLSGCVYRRDVRPACRGGKEDAVVGFLSGLDGQVQTGVVVVNIYVPHTQGGDLYSRKDPKRVKEMARLLYDMLHSIRLSGYDLRSERTIQVEEDNGTSRVTLRIKYKYNALMDRE